MDTVTAVRNRILELCGERSISINKLANLGSAALQCQEHPLWQEPESETADHQDDLRRLGHYIGRVFCNAGI